VLAKVFRDTRTRRRLLLGAYSLLLVAALTSILVASLLLLTSKVDLADRLAETADVIAGGTAVLAVIAGLVALQAYAAATGLPSLEVQVWFSTSAKNVPVFKAREVHRDFVETTDPPSQTTATISLRNRSPYAARDPLVIVKMSPIFCNAVDGVSAGDQWTVFQLPDASSSGTEVIVQWDGGPGSIVHGHSSRRLPNLNFGKLSYDRSWQPPEMEVVMIADGGYHRSAALRISFLSDTDSCQATDAPNGRFREWL
jgi:hypothetical protein